jgi:hypothetical protein
MKLDYDQANRSHLTKVPGMSPDFKSTFQKEYLGIKEFDKDHIRKTKELKSFLSSTTYSIGRKMSSPVTEGLRTPRVFTSSNFANLTAMTEKPGSNTPKISKDWVNPNLIESLEFKSPNAEPKDVFSTTTLGYTKAIKSTKIDYKKKVEDEK